MIATDITGTTAGDSASQVFNLLAVVTNPDGYAEKIKTLTQAIEDNKRYVELVGPASEVLKIREDIKVEKDRVQEELSETRKASKQALAEAKAKAKTIEDDAQAVLEQAKQQAAQLQAELADQLKEAKVATAELKKKVAKAEAAEQEARTREQSLSKALSDLEAEKVALGALRAALTAKVQAFIEDLQK